MTVLLVDVSCPACGAVNQRREVLAAVTEDCIVATKEVIWCGQCRTEIPPQSGGTPSIEAP